MKPKEFIRLEEKLLVEELMLTLIFPEL